MFTKPFSLKTVESNQPFHAQSCQDWHDLRDLPTAIKLEKAYERFQEQPTALQKNQYLHGLFDYDEELFFTLAKKHLKEMFPILYTPTVGEVIQTFNQTRLNARGLYISWNDRNDIDSLLVDYPKDSISIAILTDGERILGLGDQGVGGIEICVAKAMMYVLCGYIVPKRLLPIYLDVGTNHAKLLNDPAYKGWRHPRVVGKGYDDFIDQVVMALYKKFPNIYLHWEDITRDNAQRILSRYGSTHALFNDDVQGTGVVALAGALKATHITGSLLTEQRIVIVGGGAAGLGIANQLCRAMQRMGLTQSDARRKIWLVGRHGLLFSDSKQLTELQYPYARPAKERIDYQAFNHMENVDLYATVKQVSPTFLIGCSGKVGIFTEAVIVAMAQKVERPIIFPLSNPIICCEAKPEDILKWTKYKALIATGSPFPDLILNEKRFSISQCNNALAFPGIGLGMKASQAERVTDEMLYQASLAICEVTSSYKERQVLLPDISDIHLVTTMIAERICRVGKISTDNIKKRIHSQYWSPLVETCGLS